MSDGPAFIDPCAHVPDAPYVPTHQVHHASATVSAKSSSAQTFPLKTSSTRHAHAVHHGRRLPSHGPHHFAPGAIPPGCGAAKWIAGGLGAVGLGGGAVAGQAILKGIAGGEVIKAMANPLPSHDGWFPGWDGGGSGVSFRNAGPGIVSGLPPLSPPVDVSEPSASLVFVLACLIAMALVRLRKRLQIPIAR